MAGVIVFAGRLAIQISKNNNDSRKKNISANTNLLNHLFAVLKEKIFIAFEESNWSGICCFNSAAKICMNHDINNCTNE